MNNAVPVILVSGLQFPEGPAFAPDGALWFVEITGHAIVRIGRDGAMKRFQIGGGPTGLAIHADGGVWFADSHRHCICRLDPDTGDIATIYDRVDDTPLAGANDLAFDSVGTLIFTCPGDSRELPTGFVCAAPLGEEPRIIASELRFPNGLAFDNGGTRLLIAETRKQRVLSGEWRPDTVEWIAPVPLMATAGPIGPDGMAIGEDGAIYCAIFGAGIVQRFSPDGADLEPIATPGNAPSNCAFDPLGQWGLVVTETQRGEVLCFPDAGRGLPLYDGAAA